ncbi:MAG: hypothetical protein GQ527_09305 [Bacteroidales bacterium]|nr:hypothetical protein [Bacteroidales bacterium]
MKYLILFFLFSITNCFNSSAQNLEIVKGTLLDQNTKEPLPYANIVILQKNIGTISNEKGLFSLDISKLEKTDTLSFQYIGYKTKAIIISELDSSSIIYLKEDLINLSEAFVFGNPPDAKEIIEKVLENREKNYPKRNVKAQTFIRWRNTSDIEKAIFDLKKNTIEEIDEVSLKLAAEKIPKHNTSYIDFLGDLYFSSKDDDTLKINPIRVISLKKEEIAELEQMGKTFENLFNKSDEKEYWKIKSGVFSQKLDIDDPVENDSIAEKEDENENTTKTASYNRSINNRLGYSLLSDKDQWEFLHKTGKYNYSLVSGTKVNGEDVYMIDFSPKSSGKYQGRVYISINTYALIRADYHYAEGKMGKDFQLLGVGYKENYFSGSIYFEKKGDSYFLKYFTYKAGSFVSIDRNISLIKKRKRFLFDKKLKEIKVSIIFEVNSQESFEFLLLSDHKIDQQQLKDFHQPKEMEIIYIDHFDDDLWKGYSIIEPTKRMREYIKL